MKRKPQIVECDAMSRDFMYTYIGRIYFTVCFPIMSLASYDFLFHLNHGFATIEWNRKQ